MRDIGNADQHSPERFVEGLDFFVERGDSFGHRSDLLLALSGIASLLE